MPDDTSPASLQPPAESLEAEPGLDPTAAEAGYVFDPDSGFHWHPYAEHWFQPSTGIYLDPDGAPLAPADAEAAVAEAMQSSLDASGALDAEPAGLSSGADPAPMTELAPQPPQAGPVPHDAGPPSFDPPGAASVVPFPQVDTAPFAAFRPPPPDADQPGLDHLPQASTGEAPPSPWEWTPNAPLLVAMEMAEETQPPTMEASEWAEEGILDDGAVELLDDDAPVMPPPPAELDPSTIPTRFEEEWRVVVHRQTGAVVRGVLHGADLQSLPSIQIVGPDGVEYIETESIKAIFFMREPGVAVPTPGGRRVSLTLSDGRALDGYAPDPLPPQTGGFYILPAETRANTAWIYVFSHAIRDVAFG